MGASNKTESGGDRVHPECLTVDELYDAIWERINCFINADQIKGDPELAHLFGLFNLYQSALKDAKEYGWIGVGCITFAENRLRSYQQHPDADPRGFDEYGNYGENNPPVGDK